MNWLFFFSFLAYSNIGVFASDCPEFIERLKLYNSAENLFNTSDYSTQSSLEDITQKILANTQSDIFAEFNKIIEMGGEARPIELKVNKRVVIGFQIQELPTRPLHKRRFDSRPQKRPS